MNNSKHVSDDEELYRWIKANKNNPSKDDHYEELPSGEIIILSAAFVAGEQLSADVASINCFKPKKTKRIPSDGVIGFITGNVKSICIENHEGIIDHDINVIHDSNICNKAHALIIMNPKQNLEDNIKPSRSKKVQRQLRQCLKDIVNENNGLRIMPSPNQ